jgi:hypothetical protein
MNDSTYTDKENLKVVFSYIIFNVEGINKKYGKLSKFIKDFDLQGITNGKLYILAEMHIPHNHLADLIYDKVRWTRLEENEDYVFGIEKLVKGVRGSVSPLLYHEVPELKDIKWIGSYITLRGNFVWHVSDQEQKRNNFLAFQENLLNGRPRLKYYQELLIEYYKNCNPSTLDYNLKVCDVNNHYVYYEMDKHKGRSAIRRVTLDRHSLV